MIIIAAQGHPGYVATATKMFNYGKSKDVNMLINKCVIDLHDNNYDIISVVGYISIWRKNKEWVF